MCRRNPAPRTSRAFRYCRPWEIDRIKYVITALGFIYSFEAENQVDHLSYRAQRVLAFFAALNRCGKYGYLGTACTLEQVARAVSRATKEPCGRSTLSAALRELKEEGLMSSHRWTPEGSPPVDISRPGEAPVYRTRTISIWCLTSKALALWSGRTKNHISRPVQNLDSGSSCSDIPVKTGNNTREVPDEHRSDDPNLQQDTKVSTSSVDLSTHAPSDGKPSGSSLKHDRKVGGQAAEKIRHESGSLSSSTSFGVSQPPPPKVARNAPVTWRTAREQLLANVWYALVRYPSAIADSLYKRAEAETDPQTWPKGWPHATNWDYWLTHWPRWKWKDRRAVVKSTILPALKTPAPVFGVYEGPAEQYTGEPRERSSGSGSAAEKTANKIPSGGASSAPRAEQNKLDVGKLAPQWRAVARRLGFKDD